MSKRMKALAALSIITPAYLYALIPNTTITLESTLAIALISLLSVSILGAIALLSKENN